MTENNEGGFVPEDEARDSQSDVESSEWMVKEREALPPLPPTLPDTASALHDIWDGGGLSEAIRRSGKSGKH